MAVPPSSLAPTVRLVVVPVTGLGVALAALVTVGAVLEAVTVIEVVFDDMAPELALMEAEPLVAGPSALGLAVTEDVRVGV